MSVCQSPHLYLASLASTGLCFCFFLFFEWNKLHKIALNLNDFRNYLTSCSTNCKVWSVLLPLGILTRMHLCDWLQRTKRGHTPQPPVLVPMATASVPLQFTHILAWRRDESRHRGQPMPSEVSRRSCLCCIWSRERWQVTQDPEAAPGPNLPLMFLTTRLHWRRETRPRPAVILHFWRVCWLARIASVLSLCWHFLREKGDSCGHVSTAGKWPTAQDLVCNIVFSLFTGSYIFYRHSATLSINWFWTVVCFELN